MNHLFHHPIADHSFSADRQTLAVARDNIIQLYKRNGSKFELKDELKGHDKLITGVDIAPKSGRIVTCSQGMTKPILIFGLRYVLCYFLTIPQTGTLMCGKTAQVASSLRWFY